MVVDDEPSVRRMVSALLRDTGYQVVEASNGAEALELAASLAAELGLVVCDLSLPDIRGVELAARLREGRQNLPVVYVSGWDAGEAGVLDASSTYLQKPFPLLELLGAVARAATDGTLAAVA